MLHQWLRRADQTKGVGPTLKAYLWWGMLVRLTLLGAMCTLLVVEGNFLAEWLFASRVTPSANVEDYTVVSYVALGGFLAGGTYLRWSLLQRLGAVSNEPRSAPPADAAE